MNPPSPIRLLAGIGNAGVNVLDRICMEHPGMKELLVINNDGESLASSIVTRRIIIPPGDLREGFLAIEEEFRTELKGAASVILCGGLGGESGSFFLPALAALAKAEGITTLASVGMPFSFEGRQKRETAGAALKKLRELCDAVAVIDNDRLSGGTPSTAAVGEAFLAADRTLQSSLLALQGMLSTSGPVKITRSDLVSVLGTPETTTHFGSGRAEGANRLHEAFEMALRNPLLTVAGKGSALKEATTVLLLLKGPSDLSFAEVQTAVAEIERIAGERCHVKVGVHAAGSPGGPLELYIISASANASSLLRTPAKSVEAPPASKPTSPIPAPHPRDAARKDSSPERKASPVTRKSPIEEARPLPRPAKPNSIKQTQGVLDLDTYQRGRFDKSEPTIVAGEDLDIPTFLRKGIRIGSPSRH
jgi:cell division protein FtsZ